MDFRSCPACQASVLEDDASECPFCGASMTTGKPAGQPQPSSSQAVPAKPSSAAPAKPVPSTAGKGAPPRKPVAKAKPDNADPFDVDTSSARKATPVRPRPAKGYMIRVACPMCERPGFISESQIGKEVKCCNPQCLVPVYVANPPREAEPDPEPVADGSGKLFLYGGLTVVAIAVGIAAMVVMNKPPQPNEPVTPPIAGSQNGDPDPVQTNGPPSPPAHTEPQPLSAQEIIARSMTELQRAGELAANARERSLAARLLAESYFLNGDAAKAQTELHGLTGSSAYSAIGPWVLQAWKQLASGDRAGAEQSVEKAWALQSTLPKRGREALDMSANLAAVLAAIGRSEDAQALAIRQNDLDDGEMTALWRAAIDGGDYRFDQVLHRTCLQELTHPQWASVSQTLAGRLQSDAARTWALSAPDEVARGACCAVIAAQAARTFGSGAELSAIVDPLIAALPPAGQTRVWCAVGQGLLERGANADTTNAINQASTALKTVSVGNPITIPDLKAMYDLADDPERGLPDPLPGHSAALAAFDLYSLQLRVGDAPSARTQLDLAMQFLQGTAPSATGTGRLIHELDHEGKSLRDRLKEILKVDESVIVSRFSRYQTQVRAWDERATQRRDLENRLLARAALSGEIDMVWKIVQAAAANSVDSAAQDYFDTPLPGLLLDLATRSKQDQLVLQIKQALQDMTVQSTPTDSLRALLSQPVDSSNWKSLILDITPYYQRPPADRGLVDAAILELVVRTSASDPLAALSLAGQLPDTILREDALWLIGAHSTLAGKARQVMDGFDPRSFPKAASISFFRGCIDAAVRIK